MGVFSKFIPKAYPFVFTGTLKVGRVAGGTPSDPRVAEGFIRTKLGLDNEKLIQQAVSEIMVDRGISADEAAAELAANKYLIGFKKDENGLYLEGRQLKAAIKEAANIRWPKAAWGPSRKGTKGFFAEHVFVQEERLPLHVTEPTGVAQHFVQSRFGSSMKYLEYVDDAEVSFTITTDYEFTAEQWGLLWLTGEQQGLGANRSQGYGKYEVISWKRVKWPKGTDPADTDTDTETESE
jgi:hypothetical protein